MLVSLILGGLGNQCFQYALGRRLALAHGVPLKLATLGFRLPRYARHPYLLDRFAVEANRAGPLDYARLAADVLGGASVLRDRERGFDERVLAAGRDALLVGYWQSPKYFAGIAEAIRRELTLREPPSEATRAMAARIDAVEAVSVHVRRTDYVADPRNLALFDPCPLDYYRQAIRIVAERVTAPHFFVFSDDHRWTRENLRIDHAATYVEHNDAAHAHEDLELMRRCRHGIIANSTFSWWGAWLGERPGRVVVTPRRWFRDDGRREQDLLPDDWIRI